jgi:hypothetical protein
MNRRMQLLTALFIICGNLSVSGQKSAINCNGYQIHVAETREVITIDGILDEKPWLSAEHTGRFTCVLPVDSGYAVVQTDALLSYDESNLYVAFICYDPTPGKRVVESLRRDFTFNKNDNCMVFLDTYNDRTNC